MASRKPFLLPIRAYALELLDEAGLAITRVGVRLQRRGRDVSNRANAAWAELISKTEGSSGP